jgi:hypothetical protein
MEAQLSVTALTAALHQQSTGTSNRTGDARKAIDHAIAEEIMLTAADNA